MLKFRDSKNVISRKKALGIIGMRVGGIPKEVRCHVIDEMVRLKLLSKVNRDNLKILGVKR